MKKICAFMLILGLVLSLAACGNASTDAAETVSNAITEQELAPELEDSSEFNPDSSEELTGEALSAAEYDEEMSESIFNNEIVRTYTEAEQLPLTDEEITLTAWDYVVPPLMNVILDYGTDNTFYRELQARTGVKLEFTTANMMTASTSMSLMVAANELPDIIMNFAMVYSGSVDELVGDLLVDLQDYADIMPNYFDIIENNPDIKRDLVTAGGYIPYAVHVLDKSTPASGGVIRNEWLEADGLEVPVTLQDYEDVLLTFQNKNDCAHPFWLCSNGGSTLIASAYGVSLNGASIGSIAGWNYKDGELVYTITDEGFHSYIETLADWYQKGLISPDFFAQTYSASAGNDAITNGGAGVWMTSVNGIANLSGIESDCDIIPMANAVLEAGDEIHFDDAGTSRCKDGCAVSSNSDEIELACRLLDYAYSEDGILLANYGIEGETFEYDEDGMPALTDLVTNNPDLDFAVALLKYTSSCAFSVSDISRELLGYSQAQVDALDLWSATGEKYTAPGTLWEAENQTEYLNLSADVDSYVNTRCLQFIIGEASLDEWDDFIETVESFDLERIKELQEEAIAAYLNK